MSALYLSRTARCPVLLAQEIRQGDKVALLRSKYRICSPSSIRIESARTLYLSPAPEQWKQITHISETLVIPGKLAVVFWSPSGGRSNLPS